MHRDTAVHLGPFGTSLTLFCVKMRVSAPLHDDIIILITWCNIDISALLLPGFVSLSYHCHVLFGKLHVKLSDLQQGLFRNVRRVIRLSNADVEMSGARDELESVETVAKDGEKRKGKVMSHAPEGEGGSLYLYAFYDPQRGEIGREAI